MVSSCRLQISYPESSGFLVTGLLLTVCTRSVFCCVTKNARQAVTKYHNIVCSPRASKGCGWRFCSENSALVINYFTEKSNLMDFKGFEITSVTFWILVFSTAGIILVCNVIINLLKKYRLARRESNRRNRSRKNQNGSMFFRFRL